MAASTVSLESNPRVAPTLVMPGQKVEVVGEVGVSPPATLSSASKAPRVTPSTLSVVPHSMGHSYPPPPPPTSTVPPSSPSPDPTTLTLPVTLTPPSPPPPGFTTNPSPMVGHNPKEEEGEEAPTSTSSLGRVRGGCKANTRVKFVVCWVGVRLTTTVATPPAQGEVQGGVTHSTLSMAVGTQAVYFAESAALRVERRETLVRVGYSGSAATLASAAATGKGREEEVPERRGTGRGGLPLRVRETFPTG